MSGARLPYWVFGALWLATLALLVCAPGAHADNGYTPGVPPASTSVTLGGDATGPSNANTVARVNGTTVPAGGALTLGNVLQATGGSSATWAALNLAGGAAYVTGVLPAANQASQALGGAVGGTTTASTLNLTANGSITGVLPTANQAAQTPTLAGDATGASNATTVARVNGASVPAAGALTTGNVLQVTGASSDGYGAVNLAGGAGYVTGLLPTGNQASQSLAGAVGGTTAASTISLTTNSSITGVLPAANQASQACGGDMTGTAGACTVSKISGLSTSQTAWYFDFANTTGCASDANLGTLGTCSGGNGPLLTIGQAYKRLGGHAPTFAGGSTVVFTVLSSQPSGSATSDPWGVFAPNVPNGMFELVGSLLPSGTTFAAGAITQIVRSAAGNDFKVNVAAATSPVAGMLLYDSTVSGGSYTWIDSIAAGVATCTQPIRGTSLVTPGNNPTGGFANVNGSSWASGDTLQLYTVPTIYADTLAPAEGALTSFGAAATTGFSWIQSINFGDLSGNGSSQIVFRPTGLSALSLVRSDAFFEEDSTDNLFSFAMNAAEGWFSSGLEVRGNATVWGGSVSAANAVNSTVFHEFTTLKEDTILHGPVVCIGVVSAYNVHTASSSVIVEPSSTLVMRAGIANGSVWGATTLEVFQAGAVFNRTGGTWANNMLVTALRLDSTLSTTGSAYNDPSAGLWANGISLTSANIDTWGGLQDPISGARYTN